MTGLVSRLRRRNNRKIAKLDWIAKCDLQHPPIEAAGVDVGVGAPAGAAPRRPCRRSQSHHGTDVQPANSRHPSANLSVWGSAGFRDGLFNRRAHVAPPVDDDRDPLRFLFREPQTRQRSGDIGWVEAGEQGGQPNQPPLRTRRNAWQCQIVGD